MKKKYIGIVVFILAIFIAIFQGQKDETKTNIEDTSKEITKEIYAQSTSFTVPEFSGNPYNVINNNIPYFTETEKQLGVFEKYSDLDELGRCGVAYANLCKELMPKEKREDIRSVEPSGWQNKEYDFIEGKYIYNRCHLIGFQLAGENANEKNLITGTRYMNVQGMLPFENLVNDYIDETNNHVLYRVTPIYTDENLVCNGVLMEAYSIEDKGKGICFNVYCYNVQPGCIINYATGENEIDSNYEDENEKAEYVGNINTKKFHKIDCESVKKIKKETNKLYSTNREYFISLDYEPCKKCNP